MVYDKYRTWPLPGTLPRGPVKLGPSTSIEEMVLKDLSETGDQVEKLEILDSYAAYIQRAYRQDFAETSAAFVGQQLGQILEPVFLNRLPEPVVLHRGRAAKAD